MALQAGDIADLVAGTLNQLGKFKMTDIASALRERVAMDQLMRKSRVDFQDGLEIQWTLLKSVSNNARNVGLFAQDNINQSDGTITGKIPWRHTTTGATYDERQKTMNSGVSKIVDFVKTKIYMMDIEEVDKMESNFWEGPSSSGDSTSPYGMLDYWFTYSASEGFNGGNHTNFSAGPGGVSRTAYPNWKHYTAKYTTVNKTDLVTKIRRAFKSTNWKPIRNAAIPGYGTGKRRYGFYTTLDVEMLLEPLLEGQNDNLGPDLAPMDGRAILRRVGIEEVPYLSENHSTSDLFIGIDWDVMKTVFLSGEYFRRSPWQQNGNAHRVQEMHVDNSYNFVCYDCRKLFIIAKSDWRND